MRYRYVFLFNDIDLPSECIRFALTPLFNHDDPSQPGPNILFLEVLPEFASKLMKQDKKAMFVIRSNLNRSSSFCF